MLEIGKKSNHKVMVPLSKVGYFPNGKVKHSNEFLVALGSNYFIERTSQECQPIIERRIAKLKENMDLLEKQMEREGKLVEMAREANAAKDDQNQNSSKNWKDLDGNPTNDDSKTHWTEEGFLDIREEVEGESADDHAGGSANGNSDHAQAKNVVSPVVPASKKPVEKVVQSSPEPVFPYDPHVPSEAPVAKSPKDLQKMMEECERRNMGGAAERVTTNPVSILK